MSRLRIPVTASDRSFGPENAPLTLVHYGDYECPFSAIAHRQIQTMLAELGGRVRYVFRSFPLMQTHDHAMLACVAAEAAAEQGKFWEMHHMLFNNQELISTEGIERFASVLRLDMNRFNRDLANPELENRVKQNYMGGVRSGVTGTPTLYLNDKQFHGPLEVSLFRELLAA